jgi:TPR repeat protein
LEKAAGRGQNEAMLKLGMLYESGDGVAIDLVAAQTWYEKAVTAGNKAAAERLARLRPGSRTKN